MSIPYSWPPSLKVRSSLTLVAVAFPIRSITPIAATPGYSIAVASTSPRRLGRSVARPSHQIGRIDDQGHSPIAQDGGARNVRYAPIIRFQIFHDDLVLPEQIVNQGGHALALGLHDHHDFRRASAFRSWHAEDFVECDDRHEFVAHLHHPARRSDRMHHPGLNLE